MIFASRRWDIARSTEYKEVVARYLLVLALCAIAAGIFLRLSQLSTRAVYGDEEYTEMRVAGHTAREMITKFYDGRPTTALTLSRYAVVDPSATPEKLVSSLEQEDSQHPPLFYLAELAFIKSAGNSIVFWRMLPALFGILAIPAAFGLARELFRDSRVGLISAALFAASPIERIYSNQAREYSLFVLIVLLATWAITRANRSNTFLSWAIYSVLATAGLYTDPIMAYVLAGHALFIAAMTWLHRRLAIFLAFAAAATLSTVAYLPWICQIIIHRNDISQTNVWSATHWPMLRLVSKWIFNIGTTVFDLEYVNLRWGTVIFAFVALVAILTMFRSYRESSVETRWCLGAAMLVPAILLIAPDIVLGQHRSTVARYGLPIFAVLVVVIAKGLSTRPFSSTVVLGAALTSCVVGSFHSVWWDNDSNADDERITQVINALPNAQIITTIAPPLFVVFARRLRPSIHISLNPVLSSTQYRRGEPLVAFFPAENELGKVAKKTQLEFKQLPYTKAVTAHRIGALIAGSNEPGESTDLFVASHVPF